MLNKSCKNCRHYDGGSNISGGERNAGCRRNPPITFMIPQQTAQGVNVQFVAMFPPVVATEWCSEFSLKDNKKKQH